MSQHPEIDEAERKAHAALNHMIRRLITADQVDLTITNLASLARAAEEKACRWAERYEQAMKQGDDRAEALEARVSGLETAFKHMHVAEQGEPLSDSCAECGLDLRDPIHKRLQDV